MPASQSAPMNFRLEGPPPNIADDAWTLVEVTPIYRRYTADYGYDQFGKRMTVQRTEIIDATGFLEDNARERNETDNTPWSSGMGSDKNGNMPMVKVASVPLNVWFRDIAPRLQDGDQDFAKWYLNRDENQHLRTRRGKL